MVKVHMDFELVLVVLNKQLRMNLNENFHLKLNIYLTLLYITSRKCVSGETWWTCTMWSMTYSVAMSILSTSSWTRVAAFLIWTCPILTTIGINGAFRMTSWRCSKISIKTRTHWIAINFCTLTVGTTWRWFAWICFNWSFMNI